VIAVSLGTMSTKGRIQREFHPVLPLLEGKLLRMLYLREKIRMPSTILPSLGLV
jgi:hypothetical protein